MRVAIIAMDTRGGIQPYIGLGLGLRKAGHEVVVISPENYREFITANGLEFGRIEGDVQAFLESPDRAGATEKGFWAGHKLILELLSPMMKTWVRDALELCRGADMILGGLGGLMIGEGIAESLEVPFVQAHVQPFSPTRDYAGMLMPDSVRGRIRRLDQLSHRWTRQVFWQPLRPAINAARKSVLGLGPAPFWGNVGRVRNEDDLVLYAYSPHLLPRPSGWPSGIHVTGSWYLEPKAEWSPPSELVDFLSDGPPPIAVGFGSMSSSNAGATAELILDAAQLAGQRVVLLSGWGGMTRSDLPDSACLIKSVPHSWLFPKVALSVHHGGAGTTAATLRAGIPSVIVPFTADQPFWGWLIADRGLGSRPIPRKMLDAKQLASAITSVLGDPHMKERAAAMGRLVREENGVDRAVQILETHHAQRSVRARVPASA